MTWERLVDGKKERGKKKVRRGKETVCRRGLFA